MAPEVDPPTCAKMFTELEYTLADRLAVAEQAGLEATQANAKPGLHRLVLDGFQPFGEGLPAVVRLISEDFEHAPSVAYRLQLGKLCAELKHVSQAKFEPQFPTPCT